MLDFCRMIHHALLLDKMARYWSLAYGLITVLMLGHRWIQPRSVPKFDLCLLLFGYILNLFRIGTGCNWIIHFSVWLFKLFLYFYQVMYTPVRDLNGIPGARSLVICLTGYQREDREDIMVSLFPICYFTANFRMMDLYHLKVLLYSIFQTMVELMGAKVSKPLIANKVTHLICYKFEGVLISFT